MRIKQNAVPGQTAHIHFTPETPGDYAILCTQVCGLGHYRMLATLRVLPAAAFDNWLHAQEATKSNSTPRRSHDPRHQSGCPIHGAPFAT